MKVETTYTRDEIIFVYIHFVFTVRVRETITNFVSNQIVTSFYLRIKLAVYYLHLRTSVAQFYT